MSSALEEEAGREKKEREEQERKAALQRQQEEQDIKLEMQRKQHEAENPYVCACGKRYPKNTGLSNHKRNCPDYKAQTNGL